MLLADLLEVSQVRPSAARQFTINILEALDYLHNQGVAHGSLACDAIFLDSKPSLSARLGKLGHFRLHMDSPVLSPKWRAPEGETDAIASRRKTDIWQLGVVVTQLFLGINVVDEYHAPEMMLGRLDLSESFEDILRKAFTQDPKRRVSAFDLLPAEFLRTEAQVLESVRIPPSHESRRASSSMMSVKRRSRHNSSNVTEPISRYVMDFTEMGRLGKGGFGEVVKARNKLDGGVYAVKKVKKSLQLLDQVLSEVILLNRLNHPYVVRYTTLALHPFEPCSRLRCQVLLHLGRRRSLRRHVGRFQCHYRCDHGRSH